MPPSVGWRATPSAAAPTRPERCGWPTPTTMILWAPRCIADDSGEICRIEPSPKYSRRPSTHSGVAGNRKGMALEAIRCSMVSGWNSARRPGRFQISREAVTARVAEGPVHAGAVAGSRHGHGVDRLGLQRVVDALQRHRVVQRVDQAHGVEDGAMVMRVAPQAEHRGQAAEAHPARHVQLIDIGRTQAPPEALQFVEGRQSFRGDTGQVGHVQRAGRCADQHLEREVGRAAGFQPEHGAQGLQHAHLVRGAGAAAHQHQGVDGAAGARQARMDDGAKAHGRRAGRPGRRRLSPLQPW